MSVLKPCVVITNKDEALYQEVLSMAKEVHGVNDPTYWCEAPGQANESDEDVEF